MPRNDIERARKQAYLVVGPYLVPSPFPRITCLNHQRGQQRSSDTY